MRCPFSMPMLLRQAQVGARAFRPVSWFCPIFRNFVCTLDVHHRITAIDEICAAINFHFPHLSHFAIHVRVHRFLYIHGYVTYSWPKALANDPVEMGNSYRVTVHHEPEIAGAFHLDSIDFFFEKRKKLQKQLDSENINGLNDLSCAIAVCNVPARDWIIRILNAMMGGWRILIDILINWFCKRSFEISNSCSCTWRI